MSSDANRSTMMKSRAPALSIRTAIQPVAQPSTPHTITLEAEILKALRRGIDDGAGAAMNFEHGQAALHQAVGAQAENTVDAGKTVRARQCRRREISALRRAGQHGGKRGRVVTQGCEPRRLGLVKLLVALFER